MEPDYKKLCLELFGTTEEQELRKLAEQMKQQNPRGAGRKRKFTAEDIQTMKVLRQKGVSEKEIAGQFHTTRQTINKYLKSNVKDSCPLRIDFMFQNRVCTSIYVDFLEEKIEIENKTEDILHRAFGINEEPTWEDFQTFLEDRCFSRNRGDIKELLKTLEIDSYDPLQIAEKTKGRTVEDKQWMKFYYRGNYENDPFQRERHPQNSRPFLEGKPA